jgi:hypothetical protein
MLCRTGSRHPGQEVVGPAQVSERSLIALDPEYPPAKPNLKQTARRTQS